MSVYRDQVRQVLRAVSIRPPDRYVWRGRRSGRLAHAADPAASRDYLVHGLGQELYWSFYCRGRVEDARWGTAEPVGADARLALAVARANAGRGGWDRGWTVEALDGDEVVLVGRGLRMRAGSDACRGELVVGAAVSVRAPAEPSPLSPGFLTLIADAGTDDRDGVVRVYWHVTDRGAPELIRTLTEDLNARGVPFRLKVADHTLRFDRCDAAVLYLGLDAFPPLRTYLTETAQRLAPGLRRPVPAFTLPLAPGVGLAEGAASGASFGERRCAQLAEALVEAGVAGEDARIAAVVDRFDRDGVAIDAPFREPSLDGRHVL